MRPSLAVYRGFLVRYLADCRGQVALLALLLLAHTAAGVYAPQLLRGIVDELTARGASAALAHAAAWFLAVAAARQLTRGAAAVIGENVSWIATNRVRTDLVRHTLGLDPGFVGRHPPGAMLERIDGDANQLAAFFSQFSLRLLAAALLLTGILVALSIEDWKLCLALFLFAVAVTAMLLKLRSFGVPYYERLREAAAELHGFVEERLAAIEEIKALGALVHTLRRMTGLIGAQVHHAKRAYSLGTLVWPLVNVVMGIGTGLMMAWGGALALRGDMTLGTLYLMFSYLNLLFWPFEDLAHQMEELQKAGGNVVRIQRLLEERSSLADGTRETFPQRPASITLERVSFRYPAAGAAAAEQAELVLRDLSLTIAPGAYPRHPGPHRQRQDHHHAPAGAAVRSAGGARHRGRRRPARVPAARGAHANRGGDPGGAVLRRHDSRQPGPVRRRGRRPPDRERTGTSAPAAVAGDSAERVGHGAGERPTGAVGRRGAAAGAGARAAARSGHRHPRRGRGPARSGLRTRGGGGARRTARRAPPGW